MQTLMTALAPIAVGLVAVILGVGLWNMMRDGPANTSQKMMRARVIAQFAAIVVLMGALWIMGR